MRLTETAHMLIRFVTKLVNERSEKCIFQMDIFKRQNQMNSKPYAIAYNFPALYKYSIRNITIVTRSNTILSRVLLRQVSLLRMYENNNELPSPNYPYYISSHVIIIKI